MENNLIGARFGYLTVTATESRDKNHNLKVRVLCDCGEIKVVYHNALVQKRTKSCGCKTAEMQRSKVTHNLSNSAAYTAWKHMKSRCDNPNDPGFKNYGGRGIVYDESWIKFENFYRDMGEPPKGMSLDRELNDGNYCKDNCRWATRQTQTENRRNTILVDYRGRVQTLMQWCTELKLNYAKTKQRIRKLNWSVERAFTTP